MRAEEWVRPETRLTVPKTCHGFIADSLFSATLMGRAGQGWRSQGFLGSQGWSRW